VTESGGHQRDAPEPQPNVLSGMEPASSPGPEEASTVDQAIDLAIRFGVVALIVAASVAIALATGVIRRPGSVATTRTLPAPIRDSVVLVPIGTFPVDTARSIGDRLGGQYGIPISVASPIPLDPAAIDPGTGQYVAESVVQRIGASHPEWQNRVLVIGLMVDDMRIESVPNWRFAFAYRVGSGVAVVSAARMSRYLDVGESARWNRLAKMVTRQIAFLYWGLKPTVDASDLLYDNILSVDDIDRLSDHL